MMKSVTDRVERTFMVEKCGRADAGQEVISIVRWPLEMFFGSITKQNHESRTRETKNNPLDQR
jgi:hypothetical protein